MRFRRTKRVMPKDGHVEWRWSDDGKTWTRWERVAHAQNGYLHWVVGAPFVQVRTWMQGFGWEIGPVSVDREWMLMP